MATLPAGVHGAVRTTPILTPPTSLAILTDAAHLLADVSSFAVSLLAGYVASKASDTNFSYGYHRVEVLGALASVMTVWLVTGMLVWEAVDRIRNPQPVDGRRTLDLG